MQEEKKRKKANQQTNQETNKIIYPDNDILSILSQVSFRIINFFNVIFTFYIKSFLTKWFFSEQSTHRPPHKCMFLIPPCFKEQKSPLYLVIFHPLLFYYKQSFSY